MARYRYRAASQIGEVLEGELEATSQEEAVRRLQAQGHVPILAEEVVTRAPKRAGWRRWRVGIRVADVGSFTVELAALLQSGLPLDQALDKLARLSRNAALCEVAEDLQSQVRRGIDLSVAMEQHPRVFPRMYRNMVRAGEVSGTLHTALTRVADFLERARSLRETLVSALIYPVLLLVFAGVSVSVILGVVIPRISALFADAGQELPMATQVVVQIGEVVHKWWWAMAGILCVGVVLFHWLLENPAARTAWDRRLLALPLVGELVAKYEAARFTRTLGTLIQGGVPLLDALEIAHQVVGHRVIEIGIGSVVVSVRQGQGFARPLREAAVFPGLATDLLQVGEETGNLETMLLRVADIYDREVQTSVKRAVDILGPLLILVLAALIGAIIMSVLVAVLGINELAF